MHRDLPHRRQSGPHGSLHVATYLRPTHLLSVSLAAAAAAWICVPGQRDLDTRVLLAWNIGAFVYLLLSWFIVAKLDAAATRVRARLQYQGSLAIFVVVLVAACASAAAAGMMLQQTHSTNALSKGWHLALSVVTVGLAWLSIHTDFGFRYAARYYRGIDHDREGASFRFRSGREPDYLDFMHFSCALGINTFTSDVEIVSRDMRWLTLLHIIVSFSFNLGILAMSINVISGSLQA